MTWQTKLDRQYIHLKREHKKSVKSRRSRKSEVGEKSVGAGKSAQTGQEEHEGHEEHEEQGRNRSISENTIVVNADSERLKAT